VRSAVHTGTSCVRPNFSGTGRVKIQLCGTPFSGASYGPSTMRSQRITSRRKRISFCSRFYRLTLQLSASRYTEGDGRTPEGVYRIDHRNPDSRFHRSMRISYPSDADMQASYARHFEPGGEVRIHGLPAAKRWLGHKHRQTDWTEGCIAVSSEEMDEIWQAVALGTTVEILP